MMAISRIHILGGVALFLLAVLFTSWLFGPRLVTVDFKDAPLSKVLKAIEKQAGVRIVTNADPEKKITLKLKKAPPFEAIDTLAARADADVRAAYIAGPDKGVIKAAIDSFQGNNNPGGWTVFSSPMQGGGFRAVSDAPPADPRALECNVVLESDLTLQAALDQFSQKTGILTAVPSEWNPPVKTSSLKGRADKVGPKFVSAAGGKMQEVFLLTASNRQRPQQAQAPGPSSIFSGRMNRERMNPEWIAERAQAEIAKLPVEERADAQKQFDEGRAFWQAVRQLPEAERRAKAEEFFSRPEVQQQMEERMAARDAMRSPEQRESRYRRYLDRKKQMKGSLKS